MRVLDGAQMRAADRETIETLGVPSIVLMDQAGRQVVSAIDTHVGEVARVAVVCGRGNNGGDGWVVARVLHQRGVATLGVLLGRVDDVAGDARVMLEAARRAGVAITEVADEAAWEQVGPDLGGSDLVVDAIVGTGLGRPLTGLYAVVARDLRAAEVPVVAIDLPSGLASDTTEPPGPVIRAVLTVTLAAPKLPLVLPPASAEVGRLVVADIGIPASVIRGLDGPRLELLAADDVRPLVPRRAPDAHKGDFGRVTILAGSRGATGAACLAGLGALRAGAGLVTVATAASCLPMVARVPEYMTHGLPDRDGVATGDGLDDLLERPCDVIAAGPGLGTGAGARAIVRALLDRDRSVPLVLDADALTVVADDPDRLVGRPGAPVVITPHPGEMARLTGMTVEAVQRDRVAVARDVATTRRLFVVLKGAQTIVAAPDGTVGINTTGNPGMATGGSGDVLTGVVAGWLGQMADPTAAVTLAVYLHGLAGDLAARDLGETAVLASDVAAYLGRAVVRLTAGDDQR